MEAIPRRTDITLTTATAGVIRGLMAEYGVKQEDLARQLGRAQSYVSVRLSGRQAFDTNELDLIAELFDRTGWGILAEAARRKQRRDVGSLTEDEIAQLDTAAGGDQDLPED